MQWEYYGVEVNGRPLENEQMNEYGIQGWELVSVTYDGIRLIYYFKRKTT